MICITIAFSTAGVFLKDAFHGWDETPVITTLDSIAEPISMIQFPTVTICQDEYKPPDNWAFLETILNNVAFECSDEHDECKETIKLREDFDDVIKPVVKTFKDWLMNPTYKTTPIYDVLVNRTWHDSNSIDNAIITYYENQILRLMEDGIVLKKALYDLISTAQFAKTNTIQYELGNLSEDINYDYDDFDIFSVFQTNRFTCNTTKCEHNAKLLDVAIRFLFIMQNIKPQLQFGSFLASFAHITDKIYNHQNIFNWIDLECKEIETKKLKMHQYFEHISKIAGLMILIKI